MTDNTEQPINLEAGRTPRPVEALRDALKVRGWVPTKLLSGVDYYRHPDSPGEELGLPLYPSAADYAERYDAVMARLGPINQAAPEVESAGELRRYRVMFVDGSGDHFEATGYVVRQGWVMFLGGSEFTAPERVVKSIEVLPGPPADTRHHLVYAEPGEALHCTGGCTGTAPHLAGDVQWVLSTPTD